MAEINWIKLYTDMFNNKKIKYIRTLPEGNNILLIWIMLLTMAGSCNSNGYIFLTENIPYSDEMLSKELGFELNTIRLALQILSQLNMIQTEHHEIYISGWNEYQNVEGMEKIRLQNAKRQEKFRANKKIKALENKSNVTNNVTVTQSNATELELDKELDKELLLEERSGGSCSLQLKDVFVSYENEIGLLSPTVKETFESYQTEITVELMILAIKTAVKSNARRLNYIEGILRNWVNDSIHTVDELKAKEIEKNSKPKYTPTSKVEKFNSMASHDWDFDELENMQREHIREQLKKEGRLSE